jgi:hypothetical protein
MMCNIKSFQDGIGEIKPAKTAEELRVEAEKRGILKRSLPKETLLTVILLCPRCHARVEVDYDVWCRSELPETPAHHRFLCKKVSCEGVKYIYHKMGNE